MSSEPPETPDWNKLYEIASAQDGHFTTQQAEQAGYSPQLLLKHLKAGRVTRVRRRIYRLVHFPAGEREELAVVWLWSEQAGVFSHQTALELHDLSDVLPSQVHLTLPAPWRQRRFRVPQGVVLHYADVPDNERARARAKTGVEFARSRQLLVFERLLALHEGRGGCGFSS